MSTEQLHPDFRLNGIAFSKEVLKDAAYSFIKEGEAYEKAIGIFLSDWLDDSSIINVNTSGSTGTPKQIQLQKQQMVNSAMATGEYFELQSSDTALLCLSAEYIAGKMMLVRAMVLGLHLDYVAPNSNPLNGNEKNYQFVAMVPLQVENSLKNLHQVEKLIIGGAPVSFGLKQKLQLVNCNVFETYGMTETITHVAVRKVNDQLSVSSSLSTALKTGSFENSFKSLPNVTFAIDERNCLLIDAPKVAHTQIATNDMVNLISKTKFEWLGRYDNVINSGGIKLHPELIEAKLASVIPHPFFVAGVPDKKLGRKLVLIIESKNSKDLKDKQAFLSILEKYEIPKEVFVLPAFVRTKNGKLNRRETLKLISP